MLLTKEMVALRAACSLATVDRAIQRGEITVTRIGGRVLIDPAEARRWIEARRLPVVQFPGGEAA